MFPASAYEVTGSGEVFSGPCTYQGFWLHSEGAQTVTIHDGTSASGKILARFTAAAAGEAWRDDAQIRCENGIYVDVSAGSVAGSIRIS